jgi:hypothetical protein
MMQQIPPTASMSIPAIKPKTLLIVWIYHKAVGHVVEAISAAAQYKDSNPEISVSLLLNSNSRCDFVGFCPWIDSYYGIDPSEEPLDQLIQSLPKQWDYVIYPKRLSYRPDLYYTTELLAANTAAQKYLIAREGTEVHGDPSANRPHLGFNPGARFRIKLPQGEMEWAKTFRKSGELVVTVLLGGAGKSSMYPSLKTWQRIFDAILRRHPNARFWITGVTSDRRHGWIPAPRFNRYVQKLVESNPVIEGFIDVGLLRQMALIGESDVFLSPHSGFAFLAPCLGTPWLAISGGSWGEDFFAGMPFYCSLPRCPKYPCAHQMKNSCQLRTKLRVPVECMASFPKGRLDGICSAVGTLAGGAFSAEEAFAQYRSNAMEMGVDVAKLWRISDYFNRKERH